MPRPKKYKNNLEKQKAYDYKTRNIPFTITNGITIRLDKNNNNNKIRNKKHKVSKILTKQQPTKINNIQNKLTFTKFETWIHKKSSLSGNNSLSIGAIRFRRSDIKNIYLLIQLLKEDKILT